MNELKFLSDLSRAEESLPLSWIGDSDNISVVCWCWSPRKRRRRSNCHTVHTHAFRNDSLYCIFHSFEVNQIRICDRVTEGWERDEMYLCSQFAYRRTKISYSTARRKSNRPHKFSASRFDQVRLEQPFCELFLNCISHWTNETLHLDKCVPELIRIYCGWKWTSSTATN